MNSRRTLGGLAKGDLGNDVAVVDNSTTVGARAAVEASALTVGAHEAR